MTPEVEALRREIAELRASQLQLEDVRAWIEGSPQPHAQNTVEPHSVRDNAIGMLPFSYVWKSADQQILTATWTAVNWDAAALGGAGQCNPYGMWDAGVPSRVKATRRGWYLTVAAVAWAVNGTGGRSIIVQKNGGGVIANAPQDWAVLDSNPGAVHFAQQQHHGLFYLNVGDYVEMMVFQDSGAALDLQGTDAEAQRCKFAVVWQHDNVAPPLPA